MSDNMATKFAGKCQRMVDALTEVGRVADEILGCQAPSVPMISREDAQTMAFTTGGRIRKMKRNRRAGVGDRWTKTIRDEHGYTTSVPSANYGKGSRWRARYVDEHGDEHEKLFSVKIDAQNWINKQVSDQETGT
jgi:hypothetical protein